MKARIAVGLSCEFLEDSEVLILELVQLGAVSIVEVTFEIIRVYYESWYPVKRAKNTFLLTTIYCISFFILRYASVMIFERSTSRIFCASEAFGWVSG